MQTAIEARLFGASAPPVRIGRYVITDMIARGGMGTVYRAYDARLDRRVAVKVLNERRDTAAARLTREARALAKLNHPNVVTIHEVGDDAAGVFVAMEYVDGGTLADWCDPEVPRSRERLARLLSFAEQSAEGLIAAHALGLVHRDLKPANMLIGTDGRLRLADFGLVASGRDSPSFTGASESDLAALPLVTEAGAVVGTPAFMAPEQFEGHADERSDQFSYCATFFLAYFGVLPYAGASIAAVRASLAVGALQTPSRARVPRDVQAVLARGLSIRPEDRFADMTALLATLRAGRVRQRWFRGGVVAAGVAIAAGVAGLRNGGAAEVDPCIDGPLRSASAWNDERRRAVRDTITNIDVGYAATTAARVDTLLDAYATEWIAGYRAACEATLVERTQSHELMAARVRCLEQRQRDFAAQISVLERSDASTVANAVRSAAQLPRVQSCADATYVLAASPLPDDPELAAEVEAIDGELSLVAAEIAAGKYEDAGTRARAVVEHAERLEFGPALLRALNGLGRAEHALGRYDQALAAASRGFTMAELDDRAAATANHLVLGSVLHSRGAYAEALSQQRRALTLALRSAAPDDPDIAAIRSSIGAVLHATGEYDEAVQQTTTALTTLSASLGENHLSTALAHAGLGTVLVSQGKHDEGLAHHDQALAGAIVALGEDHPEIAVLHNNVGWARMRQGELDEALAHHRRALAIQHAALGEVHDAVATTHAYLSVVLSRQGNSDEAIAHERESIAINREVHGPDHPALASNYTNLGVLFERKGDHGAALGHFRQAMDLWERTVGEGHADFAQVLTNIGNVLEAQGDFAGALAHHERALTVATRVFGETHPMVGSIHAGIGYVLAARGRFDEALARHRRALAIDEAVLPAGHSTLAADHNAIGEVLGPLGKYDEALAEHRQALAIQLAALGEGHPNTGWSHLGIGYTLAAMGESTEALDAFRSAAAIFTAAHGEGHKGVALGAAGALVCASKLGRTADVTAELARLRAAAAVSVPAPVTPTLLALGEAMAMPSRSKNREQAVRNAADALAQQGQWGLHAIVTR